jgi:hypothetical protein
MTFSRGRLLSLTVRALLGLAIAAVFLGRSSPSTTQRAIQRQRRGGHPRHLAVDSQFFPGTPFSPRILDSATGAVAILAILDGDHLTGLACSPWFDHAGRSHLIGCWWGGEGDNRRSLAKQFGLARCTFPAGTTLDRMPCDPLPRGRPCWFPDGSDRILFAAGDGRLYHCALPGDAQNGHAELHPRPIAWEVLPPGAAAVHVGDPTWPGGPIIGGRLLVELRTLPDRSGAFRGPHLWWLQLSPDGEAVAAAGRLIAPDAPAPPCEEQSPALCKSADGRSMLAYLERRPGSHTWDLWLAAITTDAASGAPRVLASAGRRLAEGCVAVPPIFSPDGRWLYAWRRDAPDGARVQRFAVDAAADGPPARGASLGDTVAIRQCITRLTSTGRWSD